MNRIASFVVTASAFCAVALTAAYAADHTISQKGREFSESKITVKVGDSITFVNDDDITHNVHSAGGADFDLGAQKPGDKTSYTFDKAGTFKIRCAIHPKMKLKVTVEG